MATQTQYESVRITENGPGQIKLAGLSDVERGLIDGMVNGFQWITSKNGRIEAVGAQRLLPSPTDDEDMMPFWRPFVQGSDQSLQHSLFHEVEYDHISPHFTIQSLCAYRYTRENYQEQGRKLESYGFMCLRSRREESGRFWEIWYLPGLWHASGALKEATELLKGNDAVNAALTFLRRNISFGSLDVSNQRIYMPRPD